MYILYFVSNGLISKENALMRDISHLKWEIGWGPSHPYPMLTT